MQFYPAVRYYPTTNIVHLGYTRFS